MNDTYGAGRFDANVDIAEGWIEEGYTVDSMSAHLRIMIDCTEDYIRGYVDACVEKGLIEQ